MGFERILDVPVFRFFYRMFHELIKLLTPGLILEPIRRKRYFFLYKFAFDKKLKMDIENSESMTMAVVDDVMKKHGLTCRWGALMTALNGRPSKDYVSEAFFFSQIMPRVSKLEFVKAYTDKNLYHLMPFAEFTPDVILRKMSGRYYDRNYDPVPDDAIENLLKNFKGELVVKPAIESGSGINVWAGPSDQAYKELMGRAQVRDIVVQPRIYNHESLARFNSSSLNTFKIITAFTGMEYVNLGGHLRIGRAGSKTDNTGSGGMAVGIYEDGSMSEYALDKKLVKHDRHPDSGVVFKDQVLKRYQEVVEVCFEFHKYLAHFGFVGWDATIDREGRVRIVEVNLDWHGIQTIQFAHGPLLGRYKAQILKNYGIRDWVR